MTLAFRVGHDVYHGVDVPEDVPSHAVLGGFRPDGTLAPPRPRATRASLMRLGVSRVKAEHRQAAEEAEAAILAKQQAIAMRRERQRSSSPQQNNHRASSSARSLSQQQLQSSSRSRSRSVDGSVHAAAAPTTLPAVAAAPSFLPEPGPLPLHRPRVYIPPLRSFSAPDSTSTASTAGGGGGGYEPIQVIPPFRDSSRLASLYATTATSMTPASGKAQRSPAAGSNAAIAGPWCECCGLPTRNNTNGAATGTPPASKRVVFQTPDSRRSSSTSPARPAQFAVGGEWPAAVFDSASEGDDVTVSLDTATTGSLTVASPAPANKAVLEAQLRTLWSGPCILSFLLGGLVTLILHTGKRVANHAAPSSSS